jgi:Asp-tRNA(Asn)/Glu-tRNA(Gln) amidotransferase A subunit family amidase
MTTHRNPLAPVAEELRAGERDPVEYAESCLDRIDEADGDVRAFLPEEDRRERVRSAAGDRAEQFGASERPALVGVPVGVKDIFHVGGLATRAGSNVPPEELAGPQADAVSALRSAGALVLGKTVTTEFAYFEPGPTRNPHDLGHTPGGSSSGSAAAVAAGTCPLALGSQTIGSVIRPASFCGVVGVKPTYGRVPMGGVIPVAPSVDHVGFFTQDATGARLAAGALCRGWDDDVDTVRRPVIGIPDEAYLSQADPAARELFRDRVEALRAAGYEVRDTDALADVEAINDRHDDLVAAEMALSHDEWYADYGDRYAESTVELIEAGHGVSVGRLVAARGGRRALRSSLAARMDETGVDLWVAPAAPGAAPEGVDDTGDPVMNLPWTHAGVPTVGLPAGRVDGLPVGLQFAGRFGADERLLAWAEDLADAVADGSHTHVG